MNSHGALQLMVARTFDAVTLVDAKRYLRVDHDDEDALIESLIDAAHEMVEQEAGLVLSTSQWRVSLPYWPSTGFVLRPGPTTSIASVQYLDTAHTWQTLATSEYRYVHNAGSGLLEWTEDATLPMLSSRNSVDLVRITYHQGWLAATDIPQGLRMAVLMTVQDWYDRRGTVMTGTIVAPLPRAATALIALNGRPRTYAP